jgi:NCAIR mutase (PurE)-related protein
MALRLSEIAVAGNEGVLGISIVLGGDSTPILAVVQNAGYGHHLRGALLMDEFNGNKQAQ